MRKRTKAREYALQLLYQLDVTRAEAASGIEDFWQHRDVSPEVKTFATDLVRGTVKHLGELDGLISAHASNWDIRRMAVVDRNILRMGAYELLYVDDVPPKVCLNEAIELAKRFGDEKSSKFVNGILDTIHKKHLAREPQAESHDPTTPSPTPDPS